MKFILKRSKFRSHFAFKYVVLNVYKIRHLLKKYFLRMTTVDTNGIIFDTITPQVQEMSLKNVNPR